MQTTDLFTPGRKKARIEIIPLIDVVFFLLATFVLFTLSLNRITSISVGLPVAGPPTPQDSTVFLQASDPGTYFWKLGETGSSELITTSQIPGRLLAYKQSVPLPRVLIRGDDKAKFGAAVAALDLVRQSGIDHVSIETVPSHTAK